MTDFKPGDKIRQIGYEPIGTVTKVGKCNDRFGLIADPPCEETMVTFEDEHGEHSTHASDLEPA